MSKTNKFQVNERRSANYHARVWDPKLIESFSTFYNYDIDGTKLDNLKQEARKLLKPIRGRSSLLKIIDSMQRLGVAYHFEEEIKTTLNLVHFNEELDFYTTASKFQLLREHGYRISLDTYGYIVCLREAGGHIEAVDEFPEYMKICYLAMFNFGNEITSNSLRDHGLNVVSYLKEDVRTKNLAETNFLHLHDRWMKKSSSM